MKTKPYTINGDNLCDSCVVKIKYGNKYVIAKCKSQPAYLKNIENSVNAFIRGGKNNPHGIFTHLLNYVKEHPDNKFKVETLLETDNGYLLLKKEKEELLAGMKNPNFLNNQVEPVIPEYDEATDSFGWLSKNSVLNYKKWLKSTKKRTTASQ